MIPAWLGKELLKVKNGNPNYFFISGEATPKGAVSTFDKMYRQVFVKAGIKLRAALAYVPAHVLPWNCSRPVWTSVRSVAHSATHRCR